MQVQNLYNYTTLDRVNLETGRHYVIPDSFPLPSVTTILSAVSDTSYLDTWRSNVGNEVADKITNEAATLGTSIHLNLERYVNGQPFVGSFMGRELANKIVKKGLINVSTVWGMEVSLYCKELYAGTADLIGLHNNIPTIVDFKNSLRPKKIEQIDSYRAQLAAYALAHNEMYGTDIHRGVIMVAVRDATYQEFVFEGSDFDKCIDIWLNSLDKYYKINNTQTNIS